ncbi:helix-turn-helix domain-containing protein [Kribbella sp. NBC_00709]|uniref:helix-turn-helix domain-containing protein n=1 Tax=Kribbella sp. NBC_00709 TaxID=2975972 RepID=UPI002E28346D|nr:helix-turn-helix domain-containing protein [Kribbella sp. NBC_00709]
MRSTMAPPDWARVDIAVPRSAGLLPGVSMAGFRHRVPAFVEIAMVAHPAVTLIVDLSEDDGIVYDAHGRTETGSAFIGLLPHDVRAAGRLGECLQVRLSPVVAARAFGASPQLTGTVASFADVWGRGAGRFEDRLRATASWDERFAIVVDVLGRRLNASVDAEVAHSWQRTFASGGRVRVDGLASEVGWSRKRLWARFRSQLGITPKRAAQLVRFDHAAHLLASGRSVATVAAESGYVDQSHLHREVTAFAGATPAAVAAAPWLAIDDIAWPVTPGK